jgi:hypothetical protein
VDVRALTRKYRKHFTLPRLRVQYGLLGPKQWGLCVPGPTYHIFLNPQAPPEYHAKILLHELAHAEAMSLHEHYGHGKPWKTICARIETATGINPL